jgi:hypothetical protein
MSPVAACVVNSILVFLPVVALLTNDMLPLPVERRYVLLLLFSYLVVCRVEEDVWWLIVILDVYTATAEQLQVNKIPQLTRKLGEKETLPLWRAVLSIARRPAALTLALFGGFDREHLFVGQFICYFAGALVNANSMRSVLRG